jgi:hypothetical protein
MGPQVDIETPVFLPCNHCRVLFELDDLECISGGGELCAGCFDAYCQPLAGDPEVLDVGIIDL